jgi:hypothetical protein
MTNQSHLALNKFHKPTYKNQTKKISNKYSVKSMTRMRKIMYTAEYTKESAIYMRIVTKTMKYFEYLIYKSKHI